MYVFKYKYYFNYSVNYMWKINKEKFKYIKVLDKRIEKKRFYFFMYYIVLIDKNLCFKNLFLFSVDE